MAKQYLLTTREIAELVQKVAPNGDRVDPVFKFDIAIQKEMLYKGVEPHVPWKEDMLG